MTMDTQTAGTTGPASGDQDWTHDTDSQPRLDFTHWPLPVGRVEIRHGLTYVHSSRAGGFSVEEYRRIPGQGRIELLHGVVVVYPEPGEAHRRLVRHFYEMLERTCPERFDPFIGPLDVHIGRATIFAPDVLVLSTKGGPPALVVELWRNRGAHDGRREQQARLRGYNKAGVGACWVVDSKVSTVTVYELGYRKIGSYGNDEVCVAGRREGWRPWSKAG